MKVGLATYCFLFLAIGLETMATSFLYKTEQFTRLWPSVISLAGYAASFYCLSIVLKIMPVGIAYAIWCALGIVLVTTVGVVAFKQSLDFPAYLGLGLIVAGVLVINLFSKSVTHH